MIEAQNTIEDQNTRLKLNEAEHGKDTAQYLVARRPTGGVTPPHRDGGYREAWVGEAADRNGGKPSPSQ